MRTPEQDTHRRRLTYTVEVSVVHKVGPIRGADDVGDALESHLDGLIVQLTTAEAFPVRSTYEVADVEVLEETGA